MRKPIIIITKHLAFIYYVCLLTIDEPSGP